MTNSHTAPAGYPASDPHYTPPAEGRRRASVEADTRVAAFGNDFPEHAQAASGPQPRAVADALAFAGDRLDRVDHMLGSLQTTVQRLGMQLEPLFTDGSYGGGQPPTLSVDPTPEDRRSTIAKRISDLGVRADTHADWAASIERAVEAISDALEV